MDSVPVHLEKDESKPLISRIIETCRRVYGEEGDLTASKVAGIRELMKGVTKSDLGLNTVSKITEIEYVSVAEEPTFHIAIFLMPKGKRLPLHDHPRMCVLSKVVFGSLTINSYDRLNYDTIDFKAPFPCRPLLTEMEVAGSDPSLTLFPTGGGNLHELEALTDCAILDILAPPYDFDRGRPCNYYRPVPPPSSKHAPVPGGAAAANG
eukprot:CAMPEP_0113661800 /NCGR_PEP_ID=MMETSP0038_2-20120614/191_1 /TAXON_ID=2898 /ORGANISM="Cryptomonas paramecium" /LENGTH=207 /DNA_ID=CAMNT_0000576563 /DNA_START=110 /DNA_END=729 /DNA_ORIENTATION=+ /assembly_acc=CAM_ASM_000170